MGQAHSAAEIYPSAARTATPTIRDLKTPGGCVGLQLLLNISAGTTLSLTLKVRARCPLSNAIVQIAATAALTGTGTTRLTIYPGIAAVANVAINDVLPEELQIEVTHGNANSATYSLTASFLP